MYPVEHIKEIFLGHRIFTRDLRDPSRSVVYQCFSINILYHVGVIPYIEQGHTRMNGFKMFQKSLEGSIGVIYGRS